MTSQRIRPHEERPHRVYVLRDRAGVVLYVGVSSQAQVRIRTHLREQPWRAEIAPSMTIVTDEMPWEAALELEQAAIQQLKPRHNTRQRNGTELVAAGVRALVATETRLYRKALTGDPEARATYAKWRRERAAEAAAVLREHPIDLFAAAPQRRTA